MTEPTALRETGGRWTTSWYDDDGVRRWKRFGAVDRVSLRDASREYAGWLARWSSCPTIRNPGRRLQTVAALAAEYLIWARNYYRDRAGQETGEAGNIADAVRTLVEVIGSTPAEEVTPAVFMTVRDAMIRADLARTTINARMRRLRALFKWAGAAGTVPPAVYHGLQTVRALTQHRSGAREPEPVTPVARELVDAALPRMPAAVADMVRLQLLCACRPSEICELRGIDIERPKARGRAGAAGRPVWIYRPGRHKSKHRGLCREIYFGPRAQAILTPWLEKLGPELAGFVFDPSRDGRRERFGRRVRDHYDRRAYAQAIRRACIAADVAPWSPNQLRHTAATEIRARYGIERARVMLGHTTIDTTEIYAEEDRDAAVSAAREVG